MFTFTYDALGNVIGIDEFETSTACSFSYDIHGNLIRESPHPMLVKDYSYDFEKLMYTRVNDSIEDRMVFKLPQPPTKSLYFNSISRFLSFKNIFYGISSDANLSQSERFSLRNSKNGYCKLEPQSNSTYPNLQYIFQGIGKFDFSNINHAGLIYKLSEDAREISFGTCFVCALNGDSSHRIVKQIIGVSFANTMAITAYLIQEYGEQRISIVYERPGTGDATYLGEYVVDDTIDSNLHFVGFSIQISCTSLIVDFCLDCSHLFFYPMLYCTPEFTNTLVSFGKGGGASSLCDYDGTLLMPFISLGVLTPETLCSFLPIFNPIHFYNRAAAFFSSGVFYIKTFQLIVTSH